MEDQVPYNNLDELPDNVTDNVPVHAQEIYRAAYNNAWEQYKNPNDRFDDASQEETAHRVAWSAVKEKYKKGDDGNWIKK